MAKKWHPDRYTGTAKVEAEHRFRMLAEAYNMLKDAPGPGGAPGPRRPPAPSHRADPAGQPVRGASRGQPRPRRTGTGTPRRRSRRRAPERSPGPDPVRHPHGQRARRVPRPARQGAGCHEGRQAAPGAGPGERPCGSIPRTWNPTILLATTFQNLGMHARASRLWNIVHNLAPNHPIFSPAAGAGKKPSHRKSRGWASSGPCWWPMPGMRSIGS